MRYDVEPAANDAIEQAWGEQFASKVRALWWQWRETEIAYDTFVGYRMAIGKPLMSDGWNQDLDQQYWAMNALVHDVHDKAEEVVARSRRVGWLPEISDVGVLGSNSEVRVHVADGVVYAVTPEEKQYRVVDSAGFVGGTPPPVPPVPPWLIGVGVAVAVLYTIGAVVALLAIAQALRDYIVRLQKHDSEEFILKLVEKGYTLDQARGINNDITKQQVDIANANAAKDDKSQLSTFLKTMQTIVIGGAVVAAIGGAVYLVWSFAPEIKAAFSSRKRATTGA